MANSTEGEVLLQPSDVIVSQRNWDKLAMTFRLELRKQVASCQSSEQEEQEIEKPNCFLRYSSTNQWKDYVVQILVVTQAWN